MKIKLLNILLLLFVFCNAQEYIIKGSVVDEFLVPVTFAEVSIKDKENNILDTSFSDENGLFQINIITENKGNFILSIEQYKEIIFTKNIYVDKDLNLDSIIISASLNLDDIVIKGKKKVIETIGDKIYFNVENSVFSKGNSAIELLNKSPKVKISENGFKIKNKPAIILINGKIMNLSPEDLQSYLTTINSENIQSIELQETASAEQDASTSNGVINIVLKKHSTGVQVTAKNATRIYTEGKPHYYSNGYLQYGDKKLNLSLNTNWNEKRYKGNSHTFFFHNNRNKQYSFVDYTNYQNYKNFRLNANYTFNKKNEIGISTSYNKWYNYYDEIYEFIFNRINQNDISSIGHSLTSIHSENRFTTFNYKHKLDERGSHFKILLDLGDNTRPNSSDVDTKYQRNPENNNHSFTKSYSKANYFSGQIDYEQVYNKNWTLALGAKANSIHRNNTLDNFLIENNTQIPDTDKNQEFTNYELILATYLSLSKKWENHYIKIGSRIEKTNTTGTNKLTSIDFDKNYLNWFPSLYYKYDFNKNLSTNINFRKSISRPHFGDLNPYLFKSNDYAYSEGNPNLRPYYTNSLSLGLDYKNHSITIGHIKSDDYIRHIYFTNQENINIIRPVNLGKESLFGIDYSFSNNLTQWLYINFSAGFASAKYKLDEGNFKSNDWYEEIFTRIKLPEKWAIECKHIFESNFLRFNSKDLYRTYFNLMVEKSLANKKWIFRLKVNDLFNTKRADVTSYQKHFYNQFWQKRSSRNILFSIQYTFKNKDKVLKKNIESSDENRNRL